MALQFHQGRLTVARPTAASSSPGPAPMPEDPFLWSENGQRLSANDLALQRRAALAQTQPDFSPVQHWTQGLGRVASNIVGALELKQIDKQASTQRAERDGVLEALLGSTNADLLPALTSDDRIAAALAGDVFKARMPKPTTPYRFEDNAGNRWELGPDGKPNLFFTDRAPKQMVANNQLITSTNPYVDAAPLQVTDMPQPGAVIDDPRLANQGGAGPATPQTFRP